MFRSIIWMITISGVLFGCVSQNKYDTLQSSYELSQQRLSQKTQEVQLLKQEQVDLSKELQELQVRHRDVIKVSSLFNGNAFGSFWLRIVCQRFRDSRIHRSHQKG